MNLDILEMLEAAKLGLFDQSRVLLFSPVLQFSIFLLHWMATPTRKRRQVSDKYILFPQRVNIPPIFSKPD